jgi:hypothetical protein
VLGGYLSVCLRYNCKYCEMLRRHNVGAPPISRSDDATNAASMSHSNDAHTPIAGTTGARRRRADRNRCSRPVHLRQHRGSDLVYVLPSAAITQMPPLVYTSGDGGPSVGADSDASDRQPLYVCPAYDAAVGARSCPSGRHCGFVHADLSQAQRHHAHERREVENLAAVPYKRLSEVQPGPPLQVAPPNTRSAQQVLERTHVIYTRALEAGRDVLSHCAHYAGKGACDLGADCQFIHAVALHPAAPAADRGHLHPFSPALGELQGNASTSHWGTDHGVRGVAGPAEQEAPVLGAWCQWTIPTVATRGPEGPRAGGFQFPRDFTFNTHPAVSAHRSVGSASADPEFAPTAMASTEVSLLLPEVVWASTAPGYYHQRSLLRTPSPATLEAAGTPPTLPLLQAPSPLRLFESISRVSTAGSSGRRTPAHRETPF